MKYIYIVTNKVEFSLWIGNLVQKIFNPCEIFYLKREIFSFSNFNENSIIFWDYEFSNTFDNKLSDLIQEGNKRQFFSIILQTNITQVIERIGQKASISSYSGEISFLNHLETILENIEFTLKSNTDNKKNQNTENLNRCKNCLMQIFESNKIGFLSLSKNGLIQQYNKSLTHFFGINPNLALERTDFTLLFQNIFTINTSYAPFLKEIELMKLPLTNSNFENFEFNIVRKDKTKQFLSVNTNCIYNGNEIESIQYLFIDKSHERTIKSELIYEKSLLKSLMENIPDSIYFKDLDYKYTDVNQAHTILLGYDDPSEIIGKSNFDFLAIDTAIEMVKDEQLILKTGNPIISKIEKIERDDQVIWLSSTKVATRNINGQINGIVCISRDITQLKLIQDGYKRAMEKAEQAVQLKTAFLANMSHEIRTPMNAIVGFSNLLKNNVNLEKRSEFIRHINESCQNLLHLITDIIEMAKLQSGEEIITNEYFDIHECILTLHSILLETDPKPKVDIYLNIPNFKEPLLVFSDLNKITYILTSLARNALKFTEEGKIEIGYIFKESTILQFYVSDTGIGIEPQKLDLIFNSFNKLTDRKTKLYGGTGLGLAISSSFVKMLGGDMWVESELGKGSTFYFKIPFKIIEQIDNEKIENFTKNNTYKISNENKFLILIVEDEELNYILLKEALTPLKDIEIIWAKNGEEAIYYCREHKEIQLVLMDLKMPEMDGIEATKIIRGFRHDLHIWAQTAYSAPSDRRLLLDAGCDDYILKPINTETIQHKIQQKFNIEILSRK